MSIISFTAGEKNFECSKIDYFPKEEYSPDPNDSTMAIPCKYTYFEISIYFIEFLRTYNIYANTPIHHD